jgi:hypothetical protein
MVVNCQLHFPASVCRVKKEENGSRSITWMGPSVILDDVGTEKMSCICRE